MMTAATSGVSSADGRCMARVQSALGDMLSATGSTGTKNGNRRHTGMPSTSTTGIMDLSGYALHQKLRTAPGAEMYVTRMRAKVMPPRDGAGTMDSSPADAWSDRSWAKVDGCRYDPLGNVLEARMRFGRSLMVSGSVRLLYGGGNRVGASSLSSETGCDMTLRLRPRAGLEFTAMPLTMPEKSPPNRLTATPTMTIRTTATFIDPEPVDDPATAYVSIHSYNCIGGGASLMSNNREHDGTVIASSDRFEHFLSTEDGHNNELPTDGGEISIDMNEDGSTESVEVGDKRSGRHPSSSSSSSVDITPIRNTGPPGMSSPGVTYPFVSAGFVSPAPPSPEPRIRRIQYQNNNPPTPTLQSSQQQPSQPPPTYPQHPLLTLAIAGNNNNNNQYQHTHDLLLMEMEEVFVRGVRSLLAKHMERTLKPVLKDSLMANMGYTVSYG